MRKHYLLFATLFIFKVSFSQNSELTGKTNSSSFDSLFQKNSNNNYQSIKKLNLSFQTGISLCSFGKENIINKWIASGIEYNLSPKFQVKAGVLASFSNNIFCTLNKENSPFYSSNNYFLFISGDYILSDRITLSGSLLKEIPTGSMNPYAFNITNVGMNLKLSDRFSVGAGFTFVKGNNSSFSGKNFNSNTAFPYNNNFNSFVW